MKTNYIYHTILVLAICLSMNGNAQDYHFGQYDAMTPFYQPGLTGMFDNYKCRGTTQYRNQWRPMANKPFSTFAMSYDMPVNQRWGIGGYLINYDGAKVFNAFNIVLSGAYQITDPAQKKHLLTTGLQFGMIYKNINNSDLLFESQYDNGQFNPALPNNESFQKFNKLMPEVNFGIYYEWTDKENMFHPYIGGSIFHITSPKESLLNNSIESRLPRRYFFNTGVKLDINEEFKVDIKGMHQFQEKATDWTFGASGSYLLTEQKMDLILGSYYRLNDAVTILAGISYTDLTFIVSYDITTSSLKEFNGGMGAIEFTLSYTPLNMEKR